MSCIHIERACFNNPIRVVSHTVFYLDMIVWQMLKLQMKALLLLGFHLHFQKWHILSGGKLFHAYAREYTSL